jgi:hypothetical protein
MIEVRLKGGLGNQMFQYAFAYSLSRKLNKKLSLDITHFNKVSFDTKRNFELGSYPIEFDGIISSKKIFSRIVDKISTLKITEKNFSINNIPRYKLSQKIIVDGYWQSEDYFIDYSERIRNFFGEYISTNTSYSQYWNEISRSKSASIHVRRGDYVTNFKASLVHEVCDLDYFRHAINILEKKLQGVIFFIFTDDVEWVKSNFKGERFRIVSANNFNHFEELSLMAHCQNNIISNSSFSWWAAWLNRNENKCVIAPKKWFKNVLNVYGLIPASWRVI